MISTFHSIFMAVRPHSCLPGVHARLRYMRSIHTSDFAPGACSRGTLREQSSSVCTNDFMGILHPWEQNFHPAKCSTIFNRLNIWEQAPGANWANLKTLPRVYWHLQNEIGACSGSKTLRVYHFSPKALGFGWTQMKYTISLLILARSKV